MKWLAFTLLLSGCSVLFSEADKVADLGPDSTVQADGGTPEPPDAHDLADQPDGSADAADASETCSVVYQQGCSGQDVCVYVDGQGDNGQCASSTGEGGQWDSCTEHSHCAAGYICLAQTNCRKACKTNAHCGGLPETNYCEDWPSLDIDMCLPLPG